MNDAATKCDRPRKIKISPWIQPSCFKLIEQTSTFNEKNDCLRFREYQTSFSIRKFTPQKLDERFLFDLLNYLTELNKNHKLINETYKISHQLTSWILLLNLLIKLGFDSTGGWLVLVGDFRAILRIRMGLVIVSIAFGEMFMLLVGASFTSPLSADKHCKHWGMMAENTSFQLWGWLPGWLTVNMMERFSGLCSANTLQSLQAHSCIRGILQVRASDKSGDVSPPNRTVENEIGWKYKHETF